MPNRVIKESICDSERINRLSPFEEVTFYRLLVNADDYGCFDARDMVIKSRLFPLREIKTTEIKKTVERLADVGLITLYTVNGKPYLIINKWGEHQRLRVSRHKYPTPDEADQPGESDNSRRVAASCGDLPLDARAHKESESESESETESETKTRKARVSWFDRFWAEYPKKVSKAAAKKAFEKLNPTEELVNVIMLAIAKQKNSEQWQKDGGQFIPYPATWLNGQRWEDELSPAVKKKVLPAQDFEQRDYSGVQEELIKEQGERIKQLAVEFGAWDAENNRIDDEKFDAAYKARQEENDRRAEQERLSRDREKEAERAKAEEEKRKADALKTCDRCRNRDSCLKRKYFEGRGGCQTFTP